MINIATPVRYFRADEGGVSHFNYLRDNALLTGMHARLVVGAIIRWRSLLKARRSRIDPLPNPNAIGSETA